VDTAHAGPGVLLEAHREGDSELSQQDRRVAHLPERDDRQLEHTTKLLSLMG
jgi:hypothetical protein